MNPGKKSSKQFEPSGGEKKSTAESESKSGGSPGEPASAAGTEDWREQQTPKPTSPQQPPRPEPGPLPPKEKKAVARAAPEPRAPPGTAGTPITVTPYTVQGSAKFFQVGTVLVGSEQAAVESLKNQLFQPPSPR